jgi:cytoskeletal protein CcmA (bactofilin family)
VPDKRKRRLLDAMGEPVTIIGRGTEIRGEIRAGGHVLVMGTVVGDSQLEGSITVSEGGAWTGTLAGEDLVISGSVHGDVTARDRIEIRPSARIRGSVTASQIAIGEGAVVDGKLCTTGSTEPHPFIEKREAKKDPPGG